MKGSSSVVDKDTILGGVVSVGLHGAVLALLLITFPVSTHSVQPEDVKVELVPPPPSAQAEKQPDKSDTAPKASSEQRRLRPLQTKRKKTPRLSQQSLLNKRVKMRLNRRTAKPNPIRINHLPLIQF